MNTLNIIRGTKVFYPTNIPGLSKSDIFSWFYEKDKENKWVFHHHGEDIILDGVPPFEPHQISDITAQNFVNDMYGQFIDEGDDEHEVQREISLKYWHIIVKDLNCTVDHPIE